MENSFLQQEAQTFAKIVEFGTNKFDVLKALQERMTIELASFSNQNKIKFLEAYQKALDQYLVPHTSSCKKANCPQKKILKNSNFIVTQELDNLRTITKQETYKSLFNRKQTKDSLFNKIWKDTVWSKIISAFILFVLTSIYAFLTSKFQKTTFDLQFDHFWKQNFELWQYMLISIVLILAYSIIIKIRKRSFSYNDEKLVLDVNLYKKIIEQIIPQSSMVSIKQEALSSGPFKSEIIDFIIVVRAEKYKSDFEFFNPKLEKLKMSCVCQIEKLDDILMNVIFGGKNVGWLSIPPEWEFNQPDRFMDAQKRLRNQEQMLSETYDKFVRACRKALSV